MKNINLFGVALLVSTLVACGGGSSGLGNTSSSMGNSSSQANSSSEGPSSNSSAASSNDASSAPGNPSSEGPASSSDSSSSQSSHGGGDAGIRPAKIEGFAEYTDVTGGEGGMVYLVSTGTELNQALCGPRNGNRTSPVVILVNGTINHGNTTAQGCDTQDDLIEIKNTSNVSIIGVGENALFDEIGIHVRSASNIIIQNVHIRNVKKSGTPTSNGGDAIGMERDVNRVWIDHNWLEASGGESDGYDSLLDMKDNVTNVTVSYNLFNDSSRAGLVGSGDTDLDNNYITFHHNWYKNIEQRTPLIRGALVHIYNNYWSNPTSNYMIHAINSRQNAAALVESNYFYRVNNPLLAGSESPLPGCWQTNNDNTLVEHMYSRTVGNGAHVIPEIIDGQMQSTCSVSVPYTVEMDAAADVPAIVMANAGVGKIEVDTDGAIVPGGGGSSSSAGGSSSSSSSSSSSAPAGPGMTLPFIESFDTATTATLFTASYLALPSNASEPMYFKVGGNPAIVDGALSLAGSRMTIGHKPPRTGTSSGDTTGNGDLDLSSEYVISFKVVSATGSGKFQITVDNNDTSGGSSMHGSSSRVFDQSAATLNASQTYTVQSTVGTANSFIMLRTESSATVVIDDLQITYVD